MNVDVILSTMNQHDVRYLLIGGMNFMLRHKPLLTYDVDLWIEDTKENRLKCEKALTELSAEWGKTEEDWQSVRNYPPDWLAQQSIFCLNSPHGAIDIMRYVRGLDDWPACWQEGVAEKTQQGTHYKGLSDANMLKCQMALDESEQKQERIKILRTVLEEHE